MIKAIGFDYGGVFEKWGVSLFPAMSDLMGLSKEELLKEYYKYNHLGNVKDIPYDQVWHKVAEVLGKSELNDQITKIFQDRDASAQFDQRMLDLVDQLHERYKVGLLSNNSSAKGKILRERGFDKHFDVFLISAEIGYQKPDPEAFQPLYEGLNVEPQEMIYIDDSPSSLRRAEEVGFHPVLFTNYENLLEQFKILEINL